MTHANIDNPASLYLLHQMRHKCITDCHSYLALARPIPIQSMQARLRLEILQSLNPSEILLRIFIGSLFADLSGGVGGREEGSSPWTADGHRCHCIRLHIQMFSQGYECCWYHEVLGRKLRMRNTIFWHRLWFGLGDMLLLLAWGRLNPHWILWWWLV